MSNHYNDIDFYSVKALIARWRHMALTRRQEADTLRNKPAMGDRDYYLSIACHEARADAIGRLIAEMELAAYGAIIPDVGAPREMAERRQRAEQEKL